MAHNDWARQVVRAVAEKKWDKKDKIIEAGWAMCDAIEARDDFWQPLRDVVAVGQEHGVPWNDALDILIALMQAKLQD